jgi:hypothetical protein
MMGSSAKNKFLGNLIFRIKQASPEGRSDLLETFNALTLPKYFMVLTDDMIHLVYIGKETVELSRLPTMLSHTADVIWHFEPFTGIWNIAKDRTGSFQSLCPIKMGGIPERRTMSELLPSPEVDEEHEQV